MPTVSPSHSTSLLLFAFLAIVGLVVLVARFKLNSFIALALASLFVGLCSGMKLPEIVRHFQDGVGAVLASIAMVIGLGTILGRMLAESGGAESIASALTAALGPNRLPWTMMLVGFIVGIPVFFGVGLVLLVPVLFATVKQSGRPLLYLGIPMLVGLSVAHGLVPPHPGPMAAIGILKADTGKTLLYSLLIGLPTAIIVGPLFSPLLARRIPAEAVPTPGAEYVGSVCSTRPAFGITLFTILLPVLLMLLATVGDLALPKENAWRETFDLIGSPLVAMLAAVLFSFYAFGSACGFNRQQILKFSEDCLGPVAAILLVVGAGGGFSRVLVGSGVADVIAASIKTLHISPLLLGYGVAALIRVAVGSATVAITTAAGIVAPVATSLPGTNLELLVIAMGAGSSILSHLNDGGFWFVKQYFNLSVGHTLQTWTIMVSVKSVVELAFVLTLNALLG